MREVNVLLLRVAVDGDTLWSRSYGVSTEDEVGFCVRELADGGFAICGTRGWDTDERMWILRTDGNGDTLWTRTILEGCDETFGQSLVVDDDGNIVAGGYGVSSDGVDTPSLPGSLRGTRPILAKLSPDGDLIWFRRYTGPYYDTGAVALVALLSGEYCFLTNETFPGLPGPALTKVDADGDTLWVRQVDGQLMYSLDRTVEGGYVTAGYDGYSLEPIMLPHGKIVKLYPDGEEEWSGEAGSSTAVWEQFNSVVETADGGYICAGRSSSDGWLVRYEPEVGISPEEGVYGNSLLAPRPNPISSSAQIRFSLAETSGISLRVFDLSGRLVDELVSATYPEGEHELTWVPSGIEPGCYLIQLVTSEAHLTERCVYLP
jgi:hypothetical protein